jgi:hypothetical protein
MNLTEIKEQTCPECGARAVEEHQLGQHSSGRWNEVRKFACGLTLVFIPNFERTEKTTLCRNSAEYKAKQAKRRAAQAALVDFLTKLDVDEDFKKHTNIPYME